MGNYRKLEIDFVQRTLALIHQYKKLKEQFKPDEQYDHTLLINCLLGLVILPNEKILRHAPKEKMPLLKSLNQAGIKTSVFDDSIKDTKDLIRELRDSAAHFNITFVSLTNEYKIDRIKFYNDEKEICIADFASEELLPFIEWFAKELVSNFNRYEK